VDPDREGRIVDFSLAGYRSIRMLDRGEREGSCLPVTNGEIRVARGLWNPACRAEVSKPLIMATAASNTNDTDNAFLFIPQSPSLLCHYLNESEGQWVKPRS
jgi:hypothetical protein